MSRSPLGAIDVAASTLRADAEAALSSNSDYLYYVDQLATSSALPNVIVASLPNSGQVRYSTNGGLNWLTLESLPAQVWESLIAIAPRGDPAAPVRVLMANSRTVYRTGDYGITWTSCTFSRVSDDCGEDFFMDFVVSYADPNRLYLTQACYVGLDDPLDIASRIYTSSDAGVGWTLLRDSAWNPVPSPSISTRVYVRTASGWFQSDDNGVSWLGKGFAVSILTLAGQDPNRLFGLDYLWDGGCSGKRSVDGGVTWMDWSTEPCSSGRQLLGSPTVTDLVFMPDCEGGVYRSRNGGDNWERISPEYPYLLSIDYGNSGRVLLAKNDGLWTSTDGGANWMHRTDDYGASPIIGPWRRYVVSPSVLSVFDNYTFHSIDMLSATDAWAVGGGDIYPSAPILHWDGIEWTALNNPTDYGLVGIDMLSADNGLAIGFTWRGGQWESGILRWDGITWTRIFTSTEQLRSVAMVSADEGWIVGDKGTILQWNGSDWAQFTSPVSETLYSLSMVSPSEGWAVGEHGTILRWNGSVWTVFPTSDSDVHLFAVDLIAANSGWAVGTGGRVLRWNGNIWEQLSSSTTADLYAVQMVSNSEAWFVGDGGTILHWDGNALTQIQSPVSMPLYDIALSSAESGWIVGGGLREGVMLEECSLSFLPIITR
jgi:photosystem II stability/assembly factor-like uncharacterized protein